MRLFIQAALAAVVFTVLMPLAAFAQAVGADPTLVTEPTFVQQLVLALVPVIGLVITTLIGIGLALLKQKTGIDIEARHREALQSALLNGVLYALQKAGWMQGDDTAKLLPLARSYVLGSVPDALKSFGIDAATSVGQAALDRLLIPNLPVPAGTVMPSGDKLVGRA
jgi:hypothetical protein